MGQYINVVQKNAAVNPEIIARSLAQHSSQAQTSRQLQNACDVCQLNTLCLSKTLDPKAQSALQKIVKKPSVIKQGSHLFRQGEKFNSVFFIRSGAVKTYTNSINGDEVGVGFYLPGEIIGLDGIFSQEHTNSVVAIEDTFVCEFPYQALEKIMQSAPMMQKHFIELQSRQLIQSQAMAILHTQKTAEDQLSTFLINLSQRYKRLKRSSVSFRLPMSRQDIALCLGLAHETVSRLFANFQKKGWMEVKGREVQLTNLPGLNS